MVGTLRFLASALTALLTTVLAGCSIAPPSSTPIRPEAAAQGVTLVRAVPAELPDKAVALPHALFVLVPNESAAGLPIPVPFVAEAIGGVFDRNVAEGLLSPTLVDAKDAEVTEETADRVIVRLPGFMGLAGTSGGLFFGGHVLRKDQLHTFKTR